MIITYYGLACFKLQAGDDVVVVDPFGKGSGLTPPRFEAQVALISNPNDSQDFSIGGDPLIFSNPGEYETRGISVTGLETPEGTVFNIEWEGLRILHIGFAKKMSSIEPILENIDKIDILCAGTGGSATEMQKIISSIEPRIVILMQADGKKGSIEALVKEIGEKPEKLDKLTIKRKGLPTEGQRLIVLESPNS